MLDKLIITDYYVVVNTRKVVLTLEEPILIENVLKIVNTTKNKTYWDSELGKYFASITNNVININAINKFPVFESGDVILIEVYQHPTSSVKTLQAEYPVGVSNDTWRDIIDQRYIEKPVETVNESKMVEGVVVNESKQIDTITLTGNEGTANVTGAGGLTKLVTFNNTLTETASDFVTAHAAAYLTRSIVVTSVDETIIFTATLKGIIFTNPIITTVAGNLDANEVATQVNVPAVAQVDTITLSGAIGKATVGAAGGLSKEVEFIDDLSTTAANFVTDHATDYLAQAIIVTSDGDDLVFTAEVAGTGFTNPTITPIAGNLAGSVVNTQVNISAVAQIDTVTLTGTNGTAYMGATGGFSNLVTFATGGTTDLTQTAADFVTSHGSEYAGIGITVSSSGADVIFTADVPGTSFVSPVINNDTGDLAGSVANTQANAIDTAQVDTVTVTGASGQATVAAAGGLTNVIYFNGDIPTAVSDFVTAYESDYLAQEIVLTGDTNDLIFTAKVAGTGFTNPTITNTPGSQDGSVVNTQINVVAVKQVDTLTLTGTLGDTNITGAGGLTKLSEFNTSLTQTATNFKNTHAAAYLTEGIVLTSSGDDIIFTADVAGTGFTNAVSDNSTFIMTGTVANTVVDTNTGDKYSLTTENRPAYEYSVLTAVAQIDTITLTGTNGTANITLAGGLTKLVTFAAGGTTDLPQTAADFVTSHAAAYLVEGIVVTNSGSDIIFTAFQAGAEFTSPAIANASGDLAGSNTNTAANVIASTAIIAQGLVDLVNADGSKDATASRNNSTITLTYSSEADIEVVTSCDLDSDPGDETYISDPLETSDFILPVETIVIPEFRAPLGTVYSIKTENRPAYEYTMTEYKTSAEIAAELVLLIEADGSKDAVATSSGNMITLTFTTWSDVSSITSFTYDGEILLMGYSKLRINAILDVNDAGGAQIQVLGKNAMGVETEYIFANNSSTLSDADQNISFEIDVSSWVAVKIQTKATTIGDPVGTLALKATLSA